MAESTIWWILGGLAVAIEMVTGTFYLLMIALGMAAAAVSAHLGLSDTLQWVVAALVGGGAVALWHVLRGQHAITLPAASNPDVNLDIGESVYVTEWRSDRTATVKYRGSDWTVVLVADAPARAGAQKVKEVVGNRLVVEAV